MTCPGGNPQPVAEPLYAAGTRVKYWGQAGGGKYYGKEMTVLWPNVCGCKHQTYAVQVTEPDVRVLEQVLETSITPVETS